MQFYLLLKTNNFRQSINKYYVLLPTQCCEMVRSVAVLALRSECWFSDGWPLTNLRNTRTMSHSILNGQQHTVILLTKFFLKESFMRVIYMGACRNFMGRSYRIKLNINKLEPVSFWIGFQNSNLSKLRFYCPKNHYGYVLFIYITQTS